MQINFNSTQKSVFEAEEENKNKAANLSLLHASHSSTAACRPLSTLSFTPLLTLSLLLSLPRSVSTPKKLTTLSRQTRDLLIKLAGLKVSCSRSVSEYLFASAAQAAAQRYTQRN